MQCNVKWTCSEWHLIVSAYLRGMGHIDSVAGYFATHQLYMSEMQAHGGEHSAMSSFHQSRSLHLHEAGLL